MPTWAVENRPRSHHAVEADHAFNAIEIADRLLDRRHHDTARPIGEQVTLFFSISRLTCRIADPQRHWLPPGAMRRKGTALARPHAEVRLGLGTDGFAELPNHSFSLVSMMPQICSPEYKAAYCRTFGGKPPGPIWGGPPKPSRRQDAFTAHQKEDATMGPCRGGT